MAPAAPTRSLPLPLSSSRGPGRQRRRPSRSSCAASVPARDTSLPCRGNLGVSHRIGGAETLYARLDPRPVRPWATATHVSTSSPPVNWSPWTTNTPSSPGIGPAWRRGRSPHDPDARATTPRLRGRKRSWATSDEASRHLKSYAPADEASKPGAEEGGRGEGGGGRSVQERKMRTGRKRMGRRTGTRIR